MTQNIEAIKKKYKEKFVSEETVFSRINRGDHVFISTGCGEPRHIIYAFIEYIKNNPKTVLDLEIYQLWDIGSMPYGDESFKTNFRHNTFFIGRSVREAVNRGLADYTPMSLSEVPDLFRKEILPLHTAIIQISYPDERGYVSLGVNCDITKTAVEKAELVIAQMNRNMPYTRGDSLIHLGDIDYIIPFDEPLLEYNMNYNKETADAIGRNVARIVEDGETIQLGYGGLMLGVAENLRSKKNLGIHTELLSDGLVELMKSGAVDNSRKTIDRGKTIASFCMGRKETFDYINNNPSIEMKSVDYTDNLLVIAKHENFTAINSALAIDLTGQASEESTGRRFHGGIGGQANFMRAASIARNGKPILVLESLDEKGESRIKPSLPEGAGVTLNRGDVHYVVTEYGIAYLHGKSIRERAMELISIAHPKFREQLLKEAKKLNLIYKDQAFVSGKRGEYPQELETVRTTKTGLTIFMRPVKITDEELLKDFFYSLSEDSMYHRFISARMDMPHERLQEFTALDYSREMAILATIKNKGGKEEVVGIGQYSLDENTHTAEVAFAVRDDYHNLGVGKELLKYITTIAKKKGILGFTAEVLPDNKPMITLFEEMGFDVEKKLSEGIYHYKMIFKKGR